AGDHGMATDAVYLARVRGRSLDALHERTLQRIAQGDYEPDTLYIVSDDVFDQAVRHGRRDVDLFARIDGYNVIAPGWLTCGPCPAVPPHLPAAPASDAGGDTAPACRDCVPSPS